MGKENLKIDAKSIRTELKQYEKKPLDCLYEYIWNSFDAGANEVKLDFLIPQEGFGLADNVTITDNGEGWSFENNIITNNFMSTTKIHNENKTLPKGQYGRGRYTFIWISEKLVALSCGKKLTLQHDTNIEKEDSDYNEIGTQINFKQIREDFSDILLSNKLNQNLIVEFGWFLLQNNQFKIIVNGKDVNVNDLKKNSKEYSVADFPDDLKNELDENFEAKIFLWNEKPSEYSKFYFLNKSNIEIFKINTGLNKKRDLFWHSVYIKSDLFSNSEDVRDLDEEIVQNNLFDSGRKNKIRIKKKVVSFLKEELVKLRKPYLINQSKDLLKELKDERLIPDLPSFGIYDKDSYYELIKIIYTISPSLFNGKSNPEKKFICATFAGLLSTVDNNLFKTILEQIQQLTEDEKKELSEILQRTTLSNIINTIKEIDHRLEVIDKLKELISIHKKETLEVKHLQKILDENFWIFGEQFRLFSSTEGALKNVLLKYAKEIMKIEEPELESNPKGEVDLFLTKTEISGESKQKNIIVEIKRASQKLGKTQYDQIEEYMNSIKNENICNGNNQFWEFYLIGTDYDNSIEGKIESSKNHGEQEKGLCYNIKDGKFKIYVRKWSDILEVEWGTKMRYLKDKLLIQSKKASGSSQEITDNLIKK